MVIFWRGEMRRKREQGKEIQAEIYVGFRTCGLSLVIEMILKNLIDDVF